MPNWCDNSITVSHSDPKMVERFARAAVAQSLFDEFVPMPEVLKDSVSPARDEKVAESLREETGYVSWYDFAVDNWGTKWEAGVQEESVEVYDEDGSGSMCVASFDTAWSPPIQFYESLIGLGFNVDAHYYEPGMAYVGHYYNDGDEIYDDYYDYSDLKSTEIRAVIGDELDDMYGISESVADYEDEIDA